MRLFPISPWAAIILAAAQLMAWAAFMCVCPPSRFLRLRPHSESKPRHGNLIRHCLSSHAFGMVATQFSSLQVQCDAQQCVPRPAPGLGGGCRAMLLCTWYPLGILGVQTSRQNRGKLRLQRAAGRAAKSRFSQLSPIRNPTCSDQTVAEAPFHGCRWAEVPPCPGEWHFLCCFLRGWCDDVLFCCWVSPPPSSWLPAARGMRCWQHRLGKKVASWTCPWGVLRCL